MGIPGGIRWTLSALVFVCGLGLLANVSAHADTGSTTSSSDNDLHGTQSGHENAPDESSGSTVINSTPTSTGTVGAGSAVEEIAVADDSAPARTRRTVRELH